MKRYARIVAVVVVLGLLLSEGVSADAVEGTGTLRAVGAGVAHLSGSGRVDIRALGAGTIWVRGAETLAASGRGIRRDLPGGVAFLAGWYGHIHASGVNLRIEIVGGLIEFRASGTGSA